jgi:hypothetical protein
MDSGDLTTTEADKLDLALFAHVNYLRRLKRRMEDLRLPIAQSNPQSHSSYSSGWFSGIKGTLSKKLPFGRVASFTIARIAALVFIGALNRRHDGRLDCIGQRRPAVEDHRKVGVDGPDFCAECCA